MITVYTEKYRSTKAGKKYTFTGNLTAPGMSHGTISVTLVNPSAEELALQRAKCGLPAATAGRIARPKSIKSRRAVS